MNSDALVDLITREVLAVVKATSAGSPETAPTTPATPTACPSAIGDEPLFVVCGNGAGKAEVVRLFGSLRERFPHLKVLLSRAAVRLFEDSRRVFAGFTLDPSARDFAAQVAGHSCVIVLNTSVNVLAKMANLIADTPATIVVFNALKAGKPVIVTTDGLLHWFVNGGVTARIQGYLEEVAGYGVQVVSGETLATMADSPGATAAGPSPTKETDCGTCVCAGHCARHCPERVSAIRTEGAVRVACATGIENPPKDVASIIDHTLLKPDATEADVRKLCDEARRYTFASVCINPSWVRLSKQLLTGTRVKVCTVVGFPLGATSSESKAAETHQAVTDGADEIDMVINVGALKAKDDARALEDIKAVVRAAKGHIVKVILETGLLTDEEKKRGCELSVEAGADFVKTSTGFGPGGATVADIELMRHTVGPKVGVKASGGVRDFETARKMIAAGATRIGASASVAIVKGSKGEGPTAAAGKGY